MAADESMSFGLTSDLERQLGLTERRFTNKNRILYHQSTPLEIVDKLLKYQYTKISLLFSWLSCFLLY